MRIIKNSTGFTLLEVIVSLVLIGILATITSIGVSKIFQGYLFTKDNANTTLRAQIALTRLTKEFSSIDEVVSGSQTSITYSYIKDGVSISNRKVSWSGTSNAPLMIGGNTLTEDVDDFELSYLDSYDDAGDNTWSGSEKMIKVTLKLTGAMAVVSSFSICIAPKNL